MLAVLCIGFRLLTTVHYGIGVTLLTGLVVILLSFDGIAPGDTMLARGVATAIGSALALAGYLVWPSWESQRVPAAVATMIDAYRTHLMALLGGDASARAAARSARAQRAHECAGFAGTPARRAASRRALLALGEGLFANANRFIRAEHGARSRARRCTVRCRSATPCSRSPRASMRISAQSPTAFAAARRRAWNVCAPPNERSPEKPVEAVPHAEIGGDVAGAVADACDRITDSVDTLAHLLRQRKHAATAMV